MKLHALILSLVFALLVASCGTMQAYEGAELPPDQVALIKSDYSRIFDTATVRVVDGVELNAHQDHVSVLPGYHHLKIFVISNRGLYVYRSSATLALDAMAGHTYLVSGKITGGDELWVWIVDENTGEIVAGRKPD